VTASYLHWQTRLIIENMICCANTIIVLACWRVAADWRGRSAQTACLTGVMLLSDILTSKKPALGPFAEQHSFQVAA
jgi:hypothetical protein